MAAHPFDLTGKVALVTGAYRGLGFAIARGLANAGATVVLDGRKTEPRSAAAKTLADAGLKASTALFDVTDAVAIRHGIESIEASYGHLDIVVNNAGIQRRAPMAEFSKSDWDAIVATNLTAPFLVSQAALPGMIARRAGKFVHIASLLSDLARPTVVPYTAAKGGVRQLTRGMAVELAPHNIQLNAISPVYFATEMNRELIDNAEFDSWVKKRTPAGRWGQPEEIAGLAVFLSSSAADYITGQLITIDGGMSVSLWAVSGARRYDRRAPEAVLRCVPGCDRNSIWRAVQFSRLLDRRQEIRVLQDQPAGKVAGQQHPCLP